MEEFLNTIGIFVHTDGLQCNLKKKSEKVVTIRLLSR